MKLACKAFAEEMVRDDEVACLIEYLASPENTLALYRVLQGTPLSFGDRDALDALRRECGRIQTTVESYAEQLREDEAA